MSSLFQRPNHAAGTARNAPATVTSSGGPFDPPGSDAPANVPEWPWRSPGESVMAGPTVPTHDLFRPESSSEPGNEPATASSTPTNVTPEAPPVVTPSVNPGGTPGTSGSSGAPAFAAGAAAAGQVFVPMPPPSEEAFQPPAMTPVPPPKADGGKLGTWSVFFMILLVTTAVGLVDAWRTGAVGWITGAAFVVMCFLGAVLVRRRDLATAVISPPLAFLFALIFASQPTLWTAGGNALVKQASSLATGLAFNAPWIFGGTALALLVVLVRGARFRRKDKKAGLRGKAR